MRPAGTSASTRSAASAASRSGAASSADSTRPPRRAAVSIAGRRQLRGCRRGDPVDQVVCLVDDHDVVLGQDPELLQRVDREQRVVGDDDVDPPGRLPGALRKAVDAERAALGAEAFRGAHRDLAPGPVLHAGHELVAVPGVVVRRPLAAPARPAGRPRDVAPGRTARSPAPRARPSSAGAGTGSCGGPSGSRRSAPGRAAAPAPAPAAAGPGRSAGAAGRSWRSPRPRRCRRQRVRDRRDEVGQGLAGPGARLDREVLTGPDAAQTASAIAYLARPRGPADPVHRRGQQAGHGCRARAPPWPGSGPRGRGILREPSGLTGGHVRNATVPGVADSRRTTATDGAKLSANTGTSR